MTNKEYFIKDFDSLIDALNTDIHDYFSDQALEFYSGLKTEKAAAALTEMGAKILNYMKENHSNCKNLFTSHSIGDGLFMPQRSVAGAMKKLISSGYVSKTPGTPVMYSLVLPCEE